MYRLTLIILLAASVSVAKAQDKHPTKSIEPYYDISLTDAERDSLQINIEGFQKAFKDLHGYKMDNSVPMSLKFDPRPDNFKDIGTELSIL
jgi:hypothetical protein